MIVLIVLFSIICILCGVISIAACINFMIKDGFEIFYVIALLAELGLTIGLIIVIINMYSEVVI